MFTIPELAAEALGSHLAENMVAGLARRSAGLIERVRCAGGTSYRLYRHQ